MRRRMAFVFLIRVILTYQFYPDINPYILPGRSLMLDHFPAFEGPRRLAAGALSDVALAVKRAEQQRAAEPILIFSDATGRAIDLDLRGDAQAVLARLSTPTPTGASAETTAQSEPRGRG